MDKILFLDHDGVICLPHNFGSRFNKLGDGIFDNFDQKSVKVLNEIIEKTDCEIVVTSDWRIFSDIDYMSNHYKKYGIIKSPIDYTNIVGERMELGGSGYEYIDVRTREIKQYLRTHPDINKWVVVDDMDLRERSVPYNNEILNLGVRNFIHTKRRNEGIKQTGIKEKIIEFLL